MTKHGCIGSRDAGKVGIGSRLVTDRIARVYEEAIRKHARGVLLDLGCGKVPLYEVYKPYVIDNVCVDWANTLHKSPYLDYEFDLNAVIPLESAQFDTILITDVLEHILKPDMLWWEISRLLKPEGKIILSTPFFYWIHEEPHDYYRYTEHKLRMFCESNGFNVVCIEPYGGAPEIILDIIAKHIVFSRILSAIHLFFSSVFINSSIGMKLSAKSSRKFPLGYCLIAQKK